MNYGYKCTNWTEEEKQELATRLSIEMNYPIGWGTKNDGRSPYIEMDDLYDGVRIRRITWLEEKERVELVRQADNIYNEVEKARG